MAICVTVCHRNSTNIREGYQRKLNASVVLHNDAHRATAPTEKLEILNRVALVLAEQQDD